MTTRSQDSQYCFDWGSSFSQESNESTPVPTQKLDFLGNFVRQYELLTPNSRTKLDELWEAGWQVKPEKFCCKFDRHTFFRVCYIVRESLTALEAWAAIPRPDGFTSEVRHHDNGNINVKASWTRGPVTSSTEIQLKDANGYIDPPAHMRTLWPMDYRLDVTPTSSQTFILPDREETQYGGMSQEDRGTFVLASQNSFKTINVPGDPPAASEEGKGSSGLHRSATLVTVRGSQETQSQNSLIRSNTQLTSSNYGWGQPGSFFSQDSQHGSWRRSRSEYEDSDGPSGLTGVVALTSVECGLLDAALYGENESPTAQLGTAGSQNGVGLKPAESTLSNVERWVLEGATF